MTSTSPKIVVIGSINMDLVVRCDSLPRPGETILAKSSEEVCGGKGANQAVAAARAGGHVTMIGRVGDDVFANRLLTNLTDEQICCEAVQTTTNCPSGMAIVAVEQSGQNSIMVVPGANARLGAHDVRAFRNVIAAADVVLLQLEIPMDTVAMAIQTARETGVRMILDPAPVPHKFPDDLFNVDVLCPNESEAAMLSGCPVETIEEAAVAADKLHQQSLRQVVVTLGDCGAMVSDGDSPSLINPFEVTAVDTTAAGDAFAGALAVRWAEGADFRNAVHFANAAGALAASREGAQPGMPTRAEIDAILKK
ncbi:MAG: ribokinase [Fuerstiella sp.]|nr:ribokinase [Fuerstiella sp.]